MQQTIQEVNNINAHIKLAYLQKIAEMFHGGNLAPTQLATQSWTKIIQCTCLLTQGAPLVHYIIERLGPYKVSQKAYNLSNDILDCADSLMLWINQYHQWCAKGGKQGVAVLPIDPDRTYNAGLPAQAYNIAPGVVQIDFIYDNEYADEIEGILVGGDAFCAIVRPVTPTNDTMSYFQNLYDASCGR